jgi:hypothetical protein
VLALSLCQRLIQLWLRSRLQRNANTNSGVVSNEGKVGSGGIDQLEAGECCMYRVLLITI